MAEIVEVAVTDLLLDHENARLSQPEESQRDTALALAQQQGPRLFKLADHIVQHGLDPSQLPLIAPTGDARKRYVVLEGNRRVLALKALETPSLIFPALSANEQSRWSKLAGAFQENPIATIKCSLLSDGEADEWLILRHTGENAGAGLVGWGADEIDRYKARHGHRTTARQVLDFVAKHGTLSEEAKLSKTGIVSNLTRLLSNPVVRNQLGVDLSNQRLYSRFPADEVAKGLSRVVEDLKTGSITVPDIYHATDREKYAKGLHGADLPNPKKKLATQVALDDLTAGTVKPKPPSKKRARKQRAPERTTLVPKTCSLDIDPPRLNALFVEASQLSIDSFPNAGAILLRVFLELSVDHYFTNEMGQTESQRRKKSLDVKMTEVAVDLRQKKRIAAQTEASIKKAAGGSVYLVASATTFNQYVHNAYTHPTAGDLRAAWDELQPLLEGLWKKT